MERRTVSLPSRIILAATFVVRKISIRINPYGPKNKKDPSQTRRALSISWNIIYPKNEIKIPAATAEPITPEMLEDIQ